jgi:hypothetical protein
MNEETKEKIDLQRDYCKRKTGGEFYAPSDGVSWCCRRNIWDKISKEQASTELITGCPYCNRTFVD